MFPEQTLASAKQSDQLEGLNASLATCNSVTALESSRYDRPFPGSLSSVCARPLEAARSIPAHFRQDIQDRLGSLWSGAACAGVNLRTSSGNSILSARTVPTDKRNSGPRYRVAVKSFCLLGQVSDGCVVRAGRRLRAQERLRAESACEWGRAGGD